MSEATTPSTALAKADERDNFMPIMTIEDAVGRRDTLVAFVRKLMREGHDYGVIPGTERKNVDGTPSPKNNTLLKPGAEKLCTLFGLSPHFAVLEKVEDWTGKDHGGEPLFYFLYRCELTRNNLVVGQGDGSCSSWEKKYRYRNSDRVCPNCGKAAILKSKPRDGELQNKPMGYFCWKKRDGCGATFSPGCPEIESQTVGKVPNPDVADAVNTIQKMASKRALVAAVLLAVNASEFFTCDLEDFGPGVIDAEYEEAPARPAAKPAPKAEPAKPPAKANGHKPPPPSTGLAFAAAVKGADNAGAKADLWDAGWLEEEMHALKPTLSKDFADWPAAEWEPCLEWARGLYQKAREEEAKKKAGAAK